MIAEECKHKPREPKEQPARDRKVHNFIKQFLFFYLNNNIFDPSSILSKFNC